MEGTLDLEPLIAAIEEASKPNLVDYITISGLALTFLGLLFAARQLQLARATANAEFEKRRMENAIESLRHFQEQTRPQFFSISRLLMHLKQPELEALKAGETFEIPIEAKAILENLLKYASPERDFNPGDEAENKYRLSRDEASAVRYATISNLNLIESAVTPAFTGVANREIVLEQMSPYFTGIMSKRLKNTRELFGSEQLPNTFKAMHIYENTANLKDNHVSVRRFSLFRKQKD